MEMEQVQPYLDKAIELGMGYLPKVVLAIITLIVGFWIIGRITKGLNRVLGHKAVDDTLQKFMTSFVEVLLKLLLLVGLPAALGLFVLAGPLVVTLFQYRAFTATDVHMTAAALMAYAFGFMGFSLVKILVPGFYARQETRIPVRYAITALLSGMALSVTGVLVAVHFEFGAPHAVLAAATSTSAWINALLLFGRLRRDGVYVPVAAPWKTFGLRLLLANLAMVTVVVVLQGPLQLWLDLPLLDRVLRLLWVLAAAGLSYGAMLFLTGLRPHHLHRRS